MLKYFFRFFGFGLLTASAALFLFTKLNPTANLTNEEMIEMLRKNNYIVQPAKNEKTSSSLQSIEPNSLFSNQQTTAGLSSEKALPGHVTVTIKPETSANQLAYKLKEAGIIEDAPFFASYLSKNGYMDKLKKGPVVFKTELSRSEIVSILIQ